MSYPSPNRLRFLAGVALLLFAVMVVHWISDWGLVTVHVKDTPLGKVVASIARQAHVEVESSLDPATPVTMDVDLVPVTTAIDLLASRIDGSWRVVYLAAPTKGAINDATLTLRGTGKLDDWTTAYFPGPPFGGGVGTTVVDPRYLEVTMEGPDKDLSKLLNEAAQKSGVMAAMPKDWVASASDLPKAEEVRKTISALVKSAHGKMAELFLITDRGFRGGPPGDGQAGGGPPPGDGGGPPPWMGGGQNPINPEWMEQRQLAQIAKLPSDQQEEAKKDFDDRKAFFAELQKLSPDERRAKVMAFFSNPDNVQRMMDQQLLRQANQPAEQRINRSVNYLTRKAAIQSSQGGGVPATGSFPGR